MADRNVLNRWICVASALALLVAVMTSPLHPLSSSGGLSRPDCLRRNFAIPLPRSTSGPLKSLTLRIAPVKAVRAENEQDKLSRAACPSWCSLVLPPSFSLQALAWAPPALGLTRASQPLRC
jgi:hypothetical protein